MWSNGKHYTTDAKNDYTTYYKEVYNNSNMKWNNKEQGESQQLTLFDREQWKQQFNQIQHE